MTETPRRILITEDEAGIRRALRSTLGGLGFQVGESVTGEQAVETIQRQPFEVVLMDINMPGMGGIEACRRLRQMSPGLQILMLSVRDSETDKVRALDAGADDFITKPFSVGELTARIRAAFRRAANQPGKSQVIKVGEIELDTVRRIVRKGGVELRTTPKEFELLHYLMAHAGTPIPHARLLHAVWGPEYGQELEYLRTFVYHLRKKLEDNAASPRYLLTEPWVGYRFAASPA